jgi:hypothetical protein
MTQDNGASLRDRATAAEPVVSALRDGIPSAWNFAEANSLYRKDVRRLMLAEASELAPQYRAANPAMDENEAFYSAVHGAVMTIIDQLLGDEGDCPTVCTSDVAWEVMYALGFHEAQAIEARRDETQGGSVHESAVPKGCAQ